MSKIENGLNSKKFLDWDEILDDPVPFPTGEKAFFEMLGKIISPEDSECLHDGFFMLELYLNNILNKVTEGDKSCLSGEFQILAFVFMTRVTQVLNACKFYGTPSEVVEFYISYTDRVCNLLKEINEAKKNA